MPPTRQTQGHQPLSTDIERLDADDARATGLDPDAIAYTPLGELDGASDKAIRDAGAIPVTAI